MTVTVPVPGFMAADFPRQLLLHTHLHACISS